MLVALAVGMNNASGRDLEAGEKTVLQLGTGLFAALTPKQRESIDAHPVVVETNSAPIIRLEARLEKDRRKGITIISTGFIELIDQIASAEAIEIVKPGYLRKFLSTLDAEGRGFKASAEEAILASYSNEVQNERKVNFKQLMGATLAICLSQHYLGFYGKHSERQYNDKGEPMPVVLLLSSEEWDRSLEASVRNALSSGISIKSQALLLRHLDAMPRRPKWAGYFLPNTATGVSSGEAMVEMEILFFSDK
jgi:hypothetical protein